jgi:lactate dehydrogenase-like 2-hydroxyacid dehydrogenase
MRIAIFSALDFECAFFDEANQPLHHDLVYYRERLHEETARMAADSQAVCAFIADELDAATLSTLAAGGARLIALRSAGYNNVDLAATAKLGLTVLRVPAYSPHAVAEHAVALMLTLNRNIHRAYNRVRDGNFDLNGLIGFDVFGKDGRNRRDRKDWRRIGSNYGGIRLQLARPRCLSRPNVPRFRTTVCGPETSSSRVGYCIPALSTDA